MQLTEPDDQRVKGTTGRVFFFHVEVKASSPDVSALNDGQQKFLLRVFPQREVAAAVSPLRIAEQIKVRWEVWGERRRQEGRI